MREAAIKAVEEGRCDLVLSVPLVVPRRVARERRCLQPSKEHLVKIDHVKRAVVTIPELPKVLERASNALCAIAPGNKSQYVGGILVDDLAKLKVVLVRAEDPGRLDLGDNRDTAAAGMARSKAVRDVANSLFSEQAGGTLTAERFAELTGGLADSDALRRAVRSANALGAPVSSVLDGEMVLKAGVELPAEVTAAAPQNLLIEVIGPGVDEADVLARVKEAGSHREFWDLLPTDELTIGIPDPQQRKVLLLASLLVAGIELKLSLALAPLRSRGTRGLVRASLVEDINVANVVRAVVRAIDPQWKLDLDP